MTGSALKGISWRGWRKLGSWTVFGTLGCMVVAVVFNVIAFRNLGEDALRQGILSAVVITTILAGPLFFYLTLKLRELAIANHKLNRLASIDGLTGCLNRAAFTEAAERQIQAARAPGALLVIDVDNFKHINDAYGHPTGDQALQEIATAIETNVRADDLVGRLGGEEFGVLLCRLEEDEARAVGERVRRAVWAVRFAPEGRNHPLSVSIGCACFDGRISYRELFRRADARLYDAKRAGRNRVEVGSAVAGEARNSLAG